MQVWPKVISPTAAWQVYSDSTVQPTSYSQSKSQVTRIKSQNTSTRN